MGNMLLFEFLMSMSVSETFSHVSLNQTGQVGEGGGEGVAKVPPLVYFALKHFSNTFKYENW